MADERRVESRIRRGLARLLGVASGDRLALSALVLGLAGAAAFVVSLLVDWQRLSVPPVPEFGSLGGEVTVDLSRVAYGVVYPIGMLGLLTLVGLALPRPDVARRVRLAAVGLGVGMAGVTVAIVNQMRDIWRDVFGYNLIFGSLPPELQRLPEQTAYAPLPGQILGFGAVVLLVAAVWLAGRPARTRSEGGTAVAAAPASTGADGAVPVSPAPSAEAASPAATLPVPGEPPDHPDGSVRVGQVYDLTVMAAHPVDLGGHADVLRS